MADDTTSPTCRQCGYDFTGLREQGRCPECGSYYNLANGEGVRDQERDRNQRTTFLVRRVRTILLVVGAVLVMICAGGVSAMARVPAKPLYIGAFVAAVLLLAAATSYVYERDE